MASVVSASTVVAPAAFAVASSSVSTSESSSVKAFSDLEQHPVRSQGPDAELRPERQPRAVHAGVEPPGNPIGNTKFETFSYLPALNDDQISKQVDYMIQQNLIPCSSSTSTRPV